MEKPSPIYDSPSRFKSPTSHNREQTERFYNRMVLRGIPILRDGEKEQSEPVWRGDHSYNADAAAYSLSNFIEPEVAREHPEWAQLQVREEAMQRFEKRLRQDLAYEKGESAHEESTVVWQPIHTENGWELGTTYGDKIVTLSQLWEHTREYAAFAGNPSAYNASEHRAQLHMQNAFISGKATGFVSILSHPDSIRYVQVWQKTEDGRIESKHIDLFVTTGRDFSHEEGAKLIKHLQVFHNESAGNTKEFSSHAHFFVHDRKIQAQDIRTISTAFVLGVSESNIPRVDTYVPTVLIDAGHKAIRETSESMIVLGTFLRHHIDEKLIAMRKNFQKDIKKSRKPAVHSLPEYVPTKANIKRRVRNVEHVNLPEAPKIFQKRDFINSIFAEWWVTRSILQQSENLPVAGVAVLRWLTFSFTSESIPAVPLTSKKIKKDTSGTVSLIERFRFALRKHEKKTLRNYNVGLVTVPTPDGYNLPINEQTAQVREQPKKISKRLMRRVFMILKKLAVFVSKTENDSHILRVLPNTSLERKKQHTDEKVPGQQDLVRRYTFAVIIWWLIQRIPRSRDVTQYTKQSNIPKIIESRNPFLIETPHRWILFTIIWYLAALREHGKVHSTIKKNKKSKTRSLPKVPLASALPSTGIIFAFGS